MTRSPAQRRGRPWLASDVHQAASDPEGRRPAKSVRVDALIADAAQRQQLVAVRMLGKAGRAVGAIDSDAYAPALASRWCTTGTVVPDFAQDQDAYVDAVLQVCTEHRPRSLTLAHDGSVAAFRKRRADIERVVGLALAPEDALAVAVDKARTLAFAQAAGLHVPAGDRVNRPDQADAAIDDVGLPLVVKPTRSWAQAAGSGRSLRAVVVGTHAEAVAVISAVLKEGVDVLLQEWLPGDREALSLFYARGRVWARFAQRADRTYPPLGGSFVVRESIPLPPDITPAAERLVAELGFEGYSEVEFRRDARGRPALMEINTRLTASIEVAVRAGVPFPSLLHSWASGETLEVVSGYRAGLRLRWLAGDLAWLGTVLRQPAGPDVPKRGSALAAFVADCARPMRYDCLDRADLRPTLGATIGIARRVRAELAVWLNAHTWWGAASDEGGASAARGTANSA